MDVWHSRPLDVHRWSTHPEVNAFVEEVYDSLTDEQREAIKGKSNNRGRASGEVHLKVLLVDLYVAWKTDPDLCIGVARGNSAYSVNSRYNALHISSRIPKIVDALVENGFLDFTQGSYHRDGTVGRNRTSRIRPTPKLVKIFSKASIEPYQIDLHHKQECIILTSKDKVPDSDEEVKRTTIEYQDTPEIIEMRERLQRYNEFLSETYIDIPSLTDPWITRTMPDGHVQRIPTGQTNKFVRRIFSRKSWQMNGRFYGGWWQQIGKDLRKKIAINNEPTVEIDYKGLHVSILSALRGAPVKVQDRYKLKNHVLPDFTIGQQREIVKSLVLTAINAKSHKAAYDAFRDGQPNGSLEKRLKNLELELLLESFVDENPHLIDDLCSDKGIKLMYLDSQITDRIISEFIEHECPILSVHDSYIVSTYSVDNLSKAMSNASKEIVGQDLSFEQSVPGYNDVLRMRKDDRDAYLDVFSEVVAIKDRTQEYQERLLSFMDYRKNNFPHTYWLG
ncbi:hypothetical protein [Aestuariicoccus sp. MJ-SS9]|uniref:hypothetical protein n=1 Tax=Aestuariicoccus sp. MJ-SS9 TaxID=3079855 RepID=UPI00290C6D86|nr:hypothetical protein [Aestuariicoccus sp. MJ-SS9]MDU8913364.1 hypothetical protein [Aestuariicoccus sp. MJ-SS9]